MQTAPIDTAPVAPMEDITSANTGLNLLTARYTQLSQQSDTIRHRLDLAMPGWNISSPISDVNHEHEQNSNRRRNSIGMHNVMRVRTSPSTSPVRRRRLSSSSPLGPVPSLPSGGSAEIQADEDSLHDLLQQMKTELTELLNCESIKHDKALRHWVQAKLMDAELELKHYRRRRSSHTINEKTLKVFADHLSQSTPIHS